MDTLLTILTYKRGHETDSEQDFINRFLAPIPDIAVDDFGNYILALGDDPKTLFSAHVDTVHRGCGTQKVVHDPFAGFAYKDDGEPLGADDGAGIWLLLEMIKNNVPGLYVFHRGEECGGLGSRWIRDNNPQRLSGIQRAIAFDRKGYNDIITHQRGGIRGCSDEFADDLAIALGMHHAKSPGGIFTDTANYFSLIPECTNLSVGYFDEHTSNESLNLNYIQALRDKLLGLDWDSLPTVRLPTPDPRPQPRFVATTTVLKWPAHTGIPHNDTESMPQQLPTDDTPTDFELDEDLASPELLERFITRYPLEAIDMMEDYGFTRAEVARAMAVANFEHDLHRLHP